jgi:hypothetical protein
MALFSFAGNAKDAISDISAKGGRNLKRKAVLPESIPLNGPRNGHDGGNLTLSAVKRRQNEL